MVNEKHAHLYFGLDRRMYHIRRFEGCCKYFSMLLFLVIQYTPDNSNIQGTDENGSS